MSIDKMIDGAFAPIADALASVVFYSANLAEGADLKLILVWLVAGSLFFTVYFGFINIRYFGRSVRLLFQKTHGEAGQISRFQALSTSLSGTVGLGNIAGVAVAISVGGPGATFWMILMGLIGMTTKFAEISMAVKYRNIRVDEAGKEHFSGGPVYYIRAVFENKNLPFFAKTLAGFYAISLFLGTLGAASLFQTNQVYQQLLIISGGAESIFVGKAWLFGLFMVFITALVVVGGIKSIAAVTSKLVPVMALLYLAAGGVILVIFYENIPGAIQTIFSSAFSLEAGLGGFLGGLLMGVQRAVFSNEAGLGTASVAHAAVKTTSPVSQGLVAMLEPFIDTVIICTMTAMIIIVTGEYQGGGGMEGVELTSRAFASAIPWFPYVLFVVVFLFAYSTIISWTYYGVKAFTYLFGVTRRNDMIAKVLILGAIIVGACSQLDSVILLTDSTVFLMSIPNLIALYLLAPQIKRDLKDYLTRHK